MAIGFMLIAVLGSMTYFSREARQWRKPAKPPSVSRRQELLDVTPLDVNTATLKQLLLLPHTNEEKALGILNLRPIADLDQLGEIYGVGPKTLADWRPHLFVDRGTYESRGGTEVEGDASPAVAPSELGTEGPENP